MGIVSCEKHGLCGFREVCEHVYAAFRENVIPEICPVTFSQTIFLCPACYEKENMQRFEGIDFYDRISRLLEEGTDNDAGLEALAETYYAAYRNIDRRVFCTDCYSDVQLAFARNNNLPDPFTAYEHTMTHEDSEQIETLKEYLLARYDFADSIVDPHTWKKALFISSGSVARPLNILVYYVTDTAEQEKILTLINQFFKGKERYQRSVVFREKENWMPYKKDTKGFISGFTRGEEPDIRNVITR